MKENSNGTDICVGSIDEYRINRIKIKRGKSIIKIGNMELGGTTVKIEVSTKFNWLQKKLWKYLLNIDIEDIKEDE